MEDNDEPPVTDGGSDRKRDPADVIQDDDAWVRVRGPVNPLADIDLADIAVDEDQGRPDEWP